MRKRESDKCVICVFACVVCEWLRQDKCFLVLGSDGAAHVQQHTLQLVKTVTTSGADVTVVTCTIL
jgi:S-adenosylhomocysteine hydrolase